MRIGSGRTRGVTGAARWVGRAAVLLGAVCVLAAVVAPAAGANYGRIAADVRCDRNVVWTASASAEGNDDERTNEQVLVEYRAAGAEGSWTAAGPTGSFDASNDFRFSGSFALPSDVDSVELRVTPQVRWGADRDGAEPGAARFATATLPDDCADQPVIATIAADCAAGGASVTTSNVGPEDRTVTLSVDRLPVREFALAPGATSTLIVPVLEGTTAAVRVNAGEFVVAQQEVAADCSLPGPAATITERCGVHQAVVLATVADASDDTPHPVEIRAGQTIVHRSEIAGDTVLKRTIELPATGSGVPIKVTIDDDVVSTAVVGTCDGPVTGAVTCGTPGRASCTAAVASATTLPAPPPPPPPATIDLEHRALATTGPWQRAIALLVGGALLLGGGAALVVEQRRRPRPSLLANVVAPYRQRWWDES